MLEENALVAPRAGWAPPLQRVLVAFDGSPGGWAALRYGIAVAADSNAVLTVAAVANPAPWWIGLPPWAAPWTRESLQRETERRLGRALAAARDEVPADMSVSTALLHGSTASALADLADGGCYDLVVTGPRRTGRRRWRRGVTAALLSRCHASVLAVVPGSAP